MFPDNHTMRLYQFIYDEAPEEQQGRFLRGKEDKVEHF